MFIAPDQAWKVVLATLLLAAIFLSVFARAPRQAIARSDLYRLLGSAAALCCVGTTAAATHHSDLAGILFAAAIAVFTLATWLARGTDPEDPPDDHDEPVDEQPPPEPDGLPAFDWAAFETQFRAYSQRDRHPAHRQD
jgi:hypothetical protein